jgi:hypothetical protein
MGNEPEIQRRALRFLGQTLTNSPFLFTGQHGSSSPHKGCGMKYVVLVFLCINGLSALARADSSTSAIDLPANTLSTGNPSGFHLNPDDFYLNYFATYHGAPLDNPTSSHTVNVNGALSPTSAINFDSEVTTAYMITKDIGIGPDIPFQIYPTLGHGLSLGDVGLKTFDKNYVNANGPCC